MNSAYQLLDDWFSDLHMLQAILLKTCQLANDKAWDNFGSNYLWGIVLPT